MRTSLQVGRGLRGDHLGGPGRLAGRRRFALRAHRVPSQVHEA